MTTAQFKTSFKMASNPPADTPAQLIPGLDYLPDDFGMFF